MNEEGNNIVQVMNAGKLTEFWRIICDELQRRVDKLTEKIMMNEEMDEKEERRLKYKASVYLALKDFPDMLIKEHEPLIPGEKSPDPTEAY